MNESIDTQKNIQWMQILRKRFITFFFSSSPSLVRITVCMRKMKENNYIFFCSFFSTFFPPSSFFLLLFLLRVAMYKFFFHVKVNQSVFLGWKLSHVFRKRVGTVAFIIAKVKCFFTLLPYIGTIDRFNIFIKIENKIYNNGLFEWVTFWVTF